MNTLKLLALVLMAAGVLGLAYGGFSYTRQSTQAKIGPIELSVNERHTVNVPIWVGVGAILAGGVLLVVSNKRS
jgi:TRAP-type C4-dicarboxylate transport system permease small subunit